MFDTIFGLPVHALVIHAVVVLLPLMALLTVITSVRARLRERFSWWVTGANLVVFATTLVAKESGETLQKALGGQVARDHGDLGGVLPAFAFFLVAASAGVAVTSRNRTLGPIAVVISIIAAVAAVVWTVRTGDSGARAVWGR